MQVRDLIEALKQFPPTDEVCVEVEQCHVNEFDNHADFAMNFTVETVQRENDRQHGVKLTLEA